MLALGCQVGVLFSLVSSVAAVLSVAWQFFGLKPFNSFLKRRYETSY